MEKRLKAMKILWVRPYFPHPANAGNHILSLQVLRRLHRIHEIHFVAHVLPETRDVEIAGTAEYCTHYSAVTKPVYRKPLRPYILQIAREVMFGKGYIMSAHMYSEVQRLLATGEFDVAVADSVFVAPSMYGYPFMLLAHNVETVVNERHAGVQTDILLRWHHANYAKNVCNVEKEAFRRAQEILALSQVDADIIRDRFGRPGVGIMTYGADVDYFMPPETPKPLKTRDLIFLGSMDTEANIDGLHWFCEEILPLIHKERPETTLAVVGRQPDAWTQALANDPRIVVSGTVPDVRPWLQETRVSVVPLRVGGGIRIRIYETMAAGIPIVSTSVGAEGLRIAPEENILMADTPEDFARQTLRMLNDEELRLGIGRAAQEMVVRNFSWDKAASDIDAVLRQHKQTKASAMRV